MAQYFVLAAALAAGAGAQTTKNEDMVRDRGQTPTADETQTLDRGRIGTQDSVPAKPITLNGALVDAGCADRSSLNLKQPPESGKTEAPAESNQAAARQNERQARPKYAEPNGRSSETGVAAHGVDVDKRTLDAERTDVLSHQVPDLRSRESDPTCAVTGATRGFALLMDNGRLLDLDEGGNTKAVEAVQSSAAGRAMLNGNGSGIKPKVTIVGRIHGDRVFVQELRARP